MNKVNSNRLAPRAKVLVDGVRQITDVKDKLYGDPRFNLACAGELKRIFLKYAARSSRRIGPAEHHAIDEALAKIARIATGPVIVEDSYTDSASYLALAAECAILGPFEPKPIMAHDAAEEEAENITLDEVQLLEDVNESDLPKDEIRRS